MISDDASQELTDMEPLGADIAGGALSVQQEKAVAALLREPNMTRVAAEVGVSERTIYRWLAEPAFADAVRRSRREAFSQAIGLMQRYASVAVTTLVRVMTDQASSANAKVAAAGTLLKFGREGIELDDLAARLERLEEMQRQAGGGAAPWR